MKRLVVPILAVGAVLLFAARDVAMAAELEKFKGRLVGEKCAKLGKIGECYLKWASPMVIDLALSLEKLNLPMGRLPSLVSVSQGACWVEAYCLALRWLLERPSRLDIVQTRLDRPLTRFRRAYIQQPQILWGHRKKRPWR